MQLYTLYKRLHALYGPQGWWPILDRRSRTCAYRGDAPRNSRERFEICLGAILTQNVGWSNVERALAHLADIGGLAPTRLERLTDEQLTEAIRPAGYYNQKAKKIRVFTRFFRRLKRTPSREELLALWGIGPETADSIALYAYGQAHFVIDAYTTRILGHLGYVDGTEGYEALKAFCEERLPADVSVYRELHALFVRHAKEHYQRGQDSTRCPLYRELMRKAGVHS